MATIRIPAPVDVHVHLREPGFTHKEDLWTGTQAALAGGWTAVLDMPNTDPPTATPALWEDKRRRASRTAVCDVGFFVGAVRDLPPRVPARAASQAVGLKIYVNDTFGSLRIEHLGTLVDYMRTWPGPGPIVVHAEGLMLAAVIGVMALTGARVHVAHVSRADEIALIRRAKEQGLPLTCEVTPHHLFLTEEDQAYLGPYAVVRPSLGSREDQRALWNHLDVIDVFATDHAPHTREEKEQPDPPPGMPGLETALPLLLTAVHEGRLSLSQLVERISTRPRQIFHLPPPEETFTEVDTDARWTIGDDLFFTRVGWSPFAGMSVRGKVMRTVIRGREHYCHGQVLVPPGSGQVLSPARQG